MNLLDPALSASYLLRRLYGHVSTVHMLLCPSMVLQLAHHQIMIMGGSLAKRELWNVVVEKNKNVIAELGFEGPVTKEISYTVGRNPTEIQKSNLKFRNQSETQNPLWTPEIQFEQKKIESLKMIQDPIKILCKYPYTNFITGFTWTCTD